LYFEDDNKHENTFNIYDQLTRMMNSMITCGYSSYCK